MVVILAGLTFLMGPIQMLKLYAVPYWVGFSSSSFHLYVNRLQPDDDEIFWFQIDFCHVAGSCDLLASSWTRGEGALVPWKGIKLLQIAK